MMLGVRSAVCAPGQACVLHFPTLLGVENVLGVRWNQRRQQVEKTSEVTEGCSTDRGAWEQGGHTLAEGLFCVSSRNTFSFLQNEDEEDKTVSFVTILSAPFFECLLCAFKQVRERDTLADDCQSVVL